MAITVLGRILNFATSPSVGADSYKVRSICKKIIYYVVASGVLFALFALYENNRKGFEENYSLDIARDNVRQKDIEVAKKIADGFSVVRKEIDKLVVDGKLVDFDGTMENKFKSIMESHSQIFEVGLAYHKQDRKSAPNAEDSPHYGFKNNELKAFYLTYKYWEKPWFISVTSLEEAADNEGIWYEPYYGKTTGNLVVGYGVPFEYDINGHSVKGAVRANLSLGRIKNYLNNLKIGDDGYTIMLSAGGKFIAHPYTEYLNVPIDEIIDVKSAGNDFPSSVIDNEDNQEGVKEGQFYMDLKEKIYGSNEIKDDADFNDPIFQEKANVICVPVSDTGMKLCSVVLKEQLKKNSLAGQLKHSINTLIFSFLSILFFVMAVAMWIFIYHDIDATWVTSIICSLLLVVALVMFGRQLYQIDDPTNERLVDSYHALGTILNKYRSGLINANALQKDTMGSDGIDKETTIIPTGIYIQSLEFQSSNNVFITGYIWQRYEKYVEGEKVPGIIFPEAVSGNELKHSYTTGYKGTNGEGGQLHGWYFETTFRQPFDYSRYPLDRKDVWIRVWHGDIAEKALLTPDINGYDLLDEELFPGVEDSIVLSGWEKEGSGFFYKKNNYNSSFGLDQNHRFGVFPELYYVIKLKRTFLDSFITNLVPLIVVAFMLFAMLITISCDKEKAGFFGSSPFSVVTASSGLFFVVLLSHIQVREEFPISSIIYIECFYLVMYLAILWVSISSFSISLAEEGDVLHYRDGIVAKILYWPLILSLLTFSTYWAFIGW